MITRDQLDGWISLGESETLELKATTGERREATRALCAMLNHRGGRMLFGVAPTKALRTAVWETRAHRCRGTSIVGCSSSACMANSAGRINRPLDGLSATSKRGRSRVLSTRRFGAAEWTTLAHAIRRKCCAAGLRRDGTLLRGAAVLFGRASRLEVDMPQCLLRVARFRGTDRTEFLDNRQFHGNIFELIALAERFLRESLPVSGRVLPGLFERVDDPLYPPSALREALANAFCHRDYSIGGGSVAIGVYDDRLDVTSSGTRHFGSTAEVLFQPQEIWKRCTSPSATSCTSRVLVPGMTCW